MHFNEQHLKILAYYLKGVFFFGGVGGGRMGLWWQIKTIQFLNFSFYWWCVFCTFFTCCFAVVGHSWLCAFWCHDRKSFTGIHFFFTFLKQKHFDILKLGGKCTFVAHVDKGRQSCWKDCELNGEHIVWESFHQVSGFDIVTVPRVL